MLTRAAAGTAIEGDWLVAARQTAGRGRQGRTWESPPGNLYATGLVALHPSDPPAPTLALVAGIAAWDALAVPQWMLKWPNDIVTADGAKLAGILLERAGETVAVGVGINLTHHPDLPDRRTTSLTALGVALPPDAAIIALMKAFAQWLTVWRTDGLVAIRTAWLERAHPLGARLSAALPDGARVDGIFDGLSEDCALRLRLPGGAVRAIHAGDVFLV